MTTRPIIIEPPAEADLREAFDWYEQQREGLGQDFLLCVEAALAAMAERRRSFPVAVRKARRALVRRFPYSILFVEMPEAIAVVGVFHTSRNPALWRRRGR